MQVRGACEGGGAPSGSLLWLADTLTLGTPRRQPQPRNRRTGSTAQAGTTELGADGGWILDGPSKEATGDPSADLVPTLLTLDARWAPRPADGSSKGRAATALAIFPGAGFRRLRSDLVLMRLLPAEAIPGAAPERPS